MATPVSETTRLPSVPPLENGDRLTREEFERRYNAIPDLKKAELIEGVVYMPSAVRLRRHGNPHFRLIGWLGAYEVATPGVVGGDNASVRLDLDNEPQPDAFLLIDPARGGRARIDADDYVVGGPELVAEVSSSSVSFDLDVKLRVYRRNGVCEYLVWRVLDREIDWFVLRQDRYEKLAENPDGILRSEVFPGLWLDAAALVSGELVRAHQVLQQGLADPAHTAFVERLQMSTGSR